MRSSSVAPFGWRPCRPSRRCRCCRSSASRRPPRLPTKRPPRRRDAAGGVAHRERRVGALVDPLLLAVARRRARRSLPSPDDTTTMPSLTARRRDHLARHARRPLRLAVGARTRARRPCRWRPRRWCASAPGAGRRAACLPRCARPCGRCRGSMRTSVPSLPRRRSRLGVTAGANPGAEPADVHLPGHARRRRWP